MGELRVIPVTGIGEVRPGDDLAATIATAAPWLVDGDVLVVTSKIVSKAEGRLVELPPAGPARDAARDAVIEAETARPVARRGATRIVQTHHGLVMASAGVDASNVDPSKLVLLPVDPDASARALRAELRDRYGVGVAVIVTDTMGRPWRLGLVDVAIGVAGLDPLLDHRGQRDAYGNELHVTVTAVADQLAAAAELVKGKRDGVPVAVVRGWSRPSAGDGPGALALVRGPELDLFPLGTAEALAQGRAEGRVEGRSAGLREAATLGDAPAFHASPTPDLSTLDVSALDGSDFDVSALGARSSLVWYPIDQTLRELLPAGTLAIVVASAPGSAPGSIPAEHAFAVGGAVHRVRAALAAAGLATIWLPVDGLPTKLAETVAPPADGPLLGVLAVGTPQVGDDAAE